jgi:hypothetical protein
MRNDFRVAMCAGCGVALALAVAYGVLGEHSLQVPAGEPAPASWVHASLASPTPAPTLSGRLPAPKPQVRVTSATWKDKALTVAFTCQLAPGDYLFEPPSLQVEEAQLSATADSLKEARVALLGLAAGSEASANLTFESTRGSGVAALIFNPDSVPDSLIAPRVEVTVKWPMAATRTP